MENIQDSNDSLVVNIFFKVTDNFENNMSINFGYGLKKSGSIEEQTKKSIEVIPGLRVYSRNDFGTFLETDAKLCSLYFHNSTIGPEGENFYNNNDMEGFAGKSYNNHMKGCRFWDINILVNHLMIQEDNNKFRDEFVKALTYYARKNNCAIPGGETATMNNLSGMYAGLSSISIDKSGNDYDLSGKVLIAHADGVGTKSLIYKLGDYSFVIDAIAMNYNDILVALLGVPEKTFVSNGLLAGLGYEEQVKGIKKRLGTECNIRNLSLKVNNHAVMPNFRGVECDMVMTSICDREKVPVYNVEEGDVIIGVDSLGIGSNGLTAARSFADKLSLEDKIKFYEMLAVPTPVFDKVFNALEGLKIKWAEHNTGGSFTKLLKFLPQGLRMYIHRNHDLKPQELFYMIKNGILRVVNPVTNERMYSYFNNGIQLTLGFNKEDSEEAVSRINKVSNKSDIIGRVEKGKGEVMIESMYDDEMVAFTKNQ